MGAGYPDADTAEQATRPGRGTAPGLFCQPALLHHFTDGNGGNLSDGIADMRNAMATVQVAQGKAWKA